MQFCVPSVGPRDDIGGVSLTFHVRNRKPRETPLPQTSQQVAPSVTHQTSRSQPTPALWSSLVLLRRDSWLCGALTFSCRTDGRQRLGPSIHRKTVKQGQCRRGGVSRAVLCAAGAVPAMRGSAATLLSDATRRRDQPPLSKGERELQEGSLRLCFCSLRCWRGSLRCR